MLVFKVRPRRDPVVRPELTNSERRIMRIIGRAMNQVRDQVESDEGKLLDAVMHQTPGKVADMVTVEPWLRAQDDIADELLAEYTSAGRRVKLPTMQKATISFRFDAARPEAARFARTRAGLLVREITRNQRQVIQDLVSRGAMGDFTAQEIARNLRNTIGLTSEQAQWVRNFQDRRIGELLEAGRTYSEALTESAAATKRYHDRIHRYRTETIARTEILTASNEGRKQAWNQGVQQGFIGKDWVKVWSTEFDSRTCDECAPLDGETAPVTGEFEWGDPPLHPNCRCTLLLQEPERTEDFSDMSDDELEDFIGDLMDEPPPPPRPVPDTFTPGSPAATGLEIEIAMTPEA